MRKAVYFIFFSLITLFMTMCNTATDDQSSSENSEKNTAQPVDIHSFARPGEAVVTHLDWDAVVDFDTKKITAKAALTFKVTGDTDKLILDTNGLKIKNVTAGDEKLPASYRLGDGDEHLGQPLEIEIDPGVTKVTVHYETSEGAEALQWLEPIQTTGKKQPFLFTQSQAILARSWIPIQDSPGIRFTYNATVKVPKDLLALMSAENPTEKNEKGIYTFKMEQPIPSYLLALSVGDVEFRSLGERTGVYAEPSVIEKAAYEFAETEDMLIASEKLYGPYRWDRYDMIVLPPSFPFGGMENPRLTFATPTILAGDRSLTSLVAHEMAHSWSGNLVTNATWSDFWLNEGFTVYFEKRIMEALYGRSYSEMLAALDLQNLKAEVERFTAEGKADETKLKLDLTGRNPDDGVTTIAYDKGYFFLRMLEEKVGREKFDTFLKAYFEENAFKSMTTEKFVEYATKNLLTKNNIEADKNLFDAWIYTAGLPDNLPVPNAERFDKVDEAITATKNGDLSFETKEWSTHEWLHYINNLPEAMNTQELSKLDGAFSFTASGNSEVLAAWLEYAVNNKYEKAYPALEKFLIAVGRRKFLVPLYEALKKTEEGKAMALKIYEKARPNYHFVSVNTLDEMLGMTE